MSITLTNRRGRPATNIEWPEQQFTVDDLFTTLNGSLTKVAIQLKINKALEHGALVRVGTEKGKGRPRVLYAKVTNPVQPTP
jgi:predicted transcriptional regulator